MAMVFCIVEYPLLTLKWFGVNMQTNTRVILALVIFSIFIGFYIYPIYANFENLTSNVVVFVQNIESLICSYLIYFKLVVATVNQRKFTLMVQKIKTMNDNRNNYTVSDLAMAKKTLTYQRLYVNLFRITVLAMITTGIVNNQLPSGYWTLPHNYKYKITFCGQLLTLYPLIVFLVGFDIFFAGILVNIIIHCRCLQRKFESMDFEEKDQKIVMNKLKSYIKEHIQLLQLVNDVRHNFSPALFVLFTGTGIFQSLEMYMALEGKNAFYVVRSVTIGCCALFELWLYTGLIDALTAEMEKIGFKTYSCNWYSNKITKYDSILQIVIIKSQQKVHFFGLGMITMNSQAIITIFKFAWSAYTLLTAFKK